LIGTLADDRKIQTIYRFLRSVAQETISTHKAGYLKQLNKPYSTPWYLHPANSHLMVFFWFMVRIKAQTIKPCPLARAGPDFRRTRLEEARLCRRSGWMKRRTEEIVDLSSPKQKPQ
jgi:hypothetical protein